MIGKLIFPALITCLFYADSGLAQGQLYRYQNKDGIVVIDFRVPPEYAASGYEVLNKHGVVTRIVPARPTEDHNGDLSARQAAELEQERLRQWDTRLKLRYSSVSDIESARDRAMAELGVRVRILQNNRHNLRQQIEALQAQAADFERGGGIVDPALLKKMAELQREIGISGRRIDGREREMLETKAGFEEDIERFRAISESP